MFCDADPKFTTILGSCTLSLQLFNRDQAYFNPLDPTSNVKRSVIKLFDQVKAPLAQVDATISLSLLDKVTINEIEVREKAKQTIPNARVMNQSKGYEKP
jgi:hypothetical protein